MAAGSGEYDAPPGKHQKFFGAGIGWIDVDAKFFNSHFCAG
jgi:hypothetical protein